MGAPESAALDGCSLGRLFYDHGGEHTAFRDLPFERSAAMDILFTIAFVRRGIHCR